MPVLEISVVPIGTNQASFSSYVKEACKLVDAKGLKYQITPTGTVVEGSMEELMQVAQQMHQAPFQLGAQRVITNITLDERHDKSMDMESQVQAIGQNLK